MKKPAQDRLLRKLQLKESWVVFFILGIIMMNYPFLHIFNKKIVLGGFPLLFLYLEIGWLVSIFVIYLFTKAMSLIHEDAPPGADR